MFLFLSFILGLIVGSFLNVCIYRLPREQSIIWPPSSCPHCGHRLKWYELIPVISFFLQKGRCIYCKESISLQYPAVELVTGLIFLFLYIKYGLTWTYISYLFLSCLLLVSAFTDALHWKIPDQVTIPGMAAGLILSFLNPAITPMQSLTGLLLAGGVLLLVGLISRGGMGGGDIKLMGMVGAFTGWMTAVSVIFIAAMIGSIYGIVMILLKKKGRKSRVQFGVFLVIAVMLMLFFGNSLKDWYIQLIYGF